jgi:hypothetical protein
VLCAAALSVWGAAERVSFKVMLDSMVRYRYVLAQVVCLCYVPIMFGACYLRRCCLPRAMDDDAWLDMTEFSKWKFSYMAFLDALQGLAVMVLGGVVPGPLTVLLLQATTPFVAAVVASISRCRIKYSWQHIAGSLTILAGIAVNVFPLFLPGPRGGERPGGNGSNRSGNGSLGQGMGMGMGVEVGAGNGARLALASNHSTGGGGGGAYADWGGVHSETRRVQTGWNVLMYVEGSRHGGLSICYRVIGRYTSHISV